MAQDIISDGLNQIMNAKRVEKTQVEIKRTSKLLINVLEIMKDNKHIDYEIKDGKVIVKILDLEVCKAIKPRYYVSLKEIEKYERRFLPSRNFGKILISTNKGLITHDEAYKKKIGGSLIAYFF